VTETLWSCLYWSLWPYSWVLTRPTGSPNYAAGWRRSETGLPLLFLRTRLSSRWIWSDSSSKSQTPSASTFRNWTWRLMALLMWCLEWRSCWEWGFTIGQLCLSKTWGFCCNRWLIAPKYSYSSTPLCHLLRPMICSLSSVWLTFSPKNLGDLPAKNTARD